MEDIIFLGLNLGAWITIVTVLSMFLTLLFTKLREDVAFLGVSPLPFIISLMIAVSSSFATPIGSPTHMLVYGPGGYRFGDFLKIGIPMNFIILAVNLIIVNLIYSF